MAFDQNQHMIEPNTGFIIDKDKGHIVGLMPEPPAPPRPPEEYPKWVVPHTGHVVRKADGEGPVHISVPAFPDFHVNRETQEVTVLVHDEDGMNRALADPAPPKPEMPAADVGQRYAEMHEEGDAV